MNEIFFKSAVKHGTQETYQDVWVQRERATEMGAITIRSSQAQSVRSLPGTCTGVNFNNIFLPTFLCESVLHSFSLVTVWLCNLFAKEYRHMAKKATRKMLMELNPGYHL